MADLFITALAWLTTASVWNWLSIPAVVGWVMFAVQLARRVKDLVVRCTRAKHRVKYLHGTKKEDP